MVGLEGEHFVATKMNALGQRRAVWSGKSRGNWEGHQNTKLGWIELCGGRDKNQFLVVIDAEVSQEELGFSKADKKHLQCFRVGKIPVHREEGKVEGVRVKSFAGKGQLRLIRERPIHYLLSSTWPPSCRPQACIPM